MVAPLELHAPGMSSSVLQDFTLEIVSAFASNLDILNATTSVIILDYFYDFTKDF